MKLLIVVSGLLGLALGLGLAAPVEKVRRYDGDQIFQVYPKDLNEVTFLETLHADLTLGLDFWVRPNLRVPVDIHTPSERVPFLTLKLQENKIAFNVTVTNLQGLIDAERFEMTRDEVLEKAFPGQKRQQITTVCPWWNQNCVIQGGNTGSRNVRRDAVVGRWTGHSDTNSFLDRMAGSFPTMASVENIGNSFERRAMKIIKISTNGARSTKPVVFMESGIHAREWLTMGTMNYLIDRLIRDYSTDSAVKAMVDAFDFHILPVANPDGYEYTRSSDRLWRKTRQPSSSWCYGSDPNRNWDFHWAESGVSTNPCADTYPGARAFSEVETVNQANAVNRVKSRAKMYFSLHSYSQLWLTPWAYGSSKPADYSEMERVARIGESALRATHGKAFTVGTPPDILYAAAGGSYDWAKGVAGIKYAYTLELRPTRYTNNGFIVSESEIIPSGEEVFNGLRAACAEITKTRG